MNTEQTILVVDDNLTNVHLLEEILGSEGYRVVSATSAKEAHAIIHDSAVDLLLLDVMMPEVSGFDFLHTLRADEKTRQLPIMLITALNKKDDRIIGFKAGCDDFISKPFDIDELLARVKNCLLLSYYRKEVDEKKRFDMLLNKMRDGLLVCYSDGRIVQANESARRFLQVGDSMDGSVWDALYAQYTVPISRDEIVPVLGEPRRFVVVREATEETSAFCLDVSIEGIQNPVSECVSYLVTLCDVTATYHEKIMKHNFLDLISHKLRSPITALSVGLDALKDHLSNSDVTFLSVFEKAVVDLQTLIERLIGFAFIEKTVLQKPKEEIAIMEFVKQLSAEIEKRYDAVVVESAVESEDASLCVRVHKEYFELALTQIIENAIKFNDRKPVRIRSHIYREAGTIVIAISDNGKGVPCEKYDAIFEPFYQVEKDFTGAVGGFGIGLAIVKKFMKLCGGDVRVRPSDMGGSCFLLSFPDTGAAS